MNHLRPAQQEILRYRGGKMGVSAVPGSGKTFTLSELAASIIARNVLEDDQEILIVTLVNSAVDNFTARIGEKIAKQGFFPSLGYRVRTLHGLAHDIVRGRPGLVGLDEKFQIVDETEANRIRQAAAQTWLSANPGFFEAYWSEELDEKKRQGILRDRIPELIENVAVAFIGSAKDAQLTPADIRRVLDGLPVRLPLAELGAAIYSDYQRALEYRGAVDFNDLVRLALRAISLDEQYLERLRHNWPYILEDEAQDSSRLQEEILSRLAGEGGNWVRVGDPNQAIYETFTTASPRYLKDFIRREDVLHYDLPESGRSTQSIITLANHLIDWTMESHPRPEIREALTLPHIEATAPGDPQANPPDEPGKIHMMYRKQTPAEEVRLVAESLAKWLPDHPDETVAALSPRNQRGVDLVEVLKRMNIPHVELLKSTNSTRMAAGALANVMNSIADPQNANRLVTAYRVWRRASREDEQASELVSRTAERLKKCKQVEDYIWSRAGKDWLEETAAEVEEGVFEELRQFREKMQRWHGAAQLPIDQAVLTLAQDLFTAPGDLAVAHKLAVVLRQENNAHNAWRLPELTQELAVIAKNERKFIGLSEEDSGFKPEAHKGKVVVTTIHKAKGLEWDRVYLMSANTYDFPSGSPSDTYISEKWFLRGHLNLEAETLEQLRIALSHDEYEWYEEGGATVTARQDYISERLRLLYVGITRAKKELIITWNSGRENFPSGPALALIELENFWRQHQGAGTEQQPAGEAG